MVEVIRLKEEIERKIDLTTSEQEINDIKQDLASYIKDFDKIVGEKIVIFNDLVGKLGGIIDSNSGTV
jgi:hypothetical protein